MKRKLLNQSAFALVGFFALSACTVNINSNANTSANRNAETPANVASATPTTKTHWTVAVCSSRSSEVTLQAGPNEADTQTFATWKTGSSQKIYELPARVQNLSEIHFRAIGSEANPVELCVLYDGRPKKRVAFDEGSENHTVGASDDDDNDCRCTQ